MIAPLQPDARYRGVDERRIVDMLMLHGWIHRFRNGDREGATSDVEEYLNRLVRFGLPFAQAGGGTRCFDPAEVINFIKWTGLNGGDQVWQDQLVGTLRRLVLEQYPNPSATAPADPATLGPQRFAVTFEREFNLDGIQGLDTIRLRLPLPLEDAFLRDLKIAPYSPSDAGVDFQIAPGRLDAMFPMPRERNATLGIEVEFSAYPVGDVARGSALSPEEVALYTSAREGLVQVTSRVRSLSAELAGSAREPLQIVRKYWDFLLDQKISGIIHYDLLNPDRPGEWILDNGWFDCQVGSALLIALCRAQGIPARIVGGYTLYPASPAEHYWAEIWVADAWRPFDTICADLSVQGRERVWRDHFFGRLDYRMKTQCLPRLFNSNPVIRLPRAWHRTVRPTEQGVEICYYANATGAFVHRDRFSVRRAEPA